ncbi:MAG TPA: hypothetical protein VI603_07995 [Saprospiraceae bacterium]|nr:hypothetical protein [Saprospiraceae bacterium]
MKKYSINLVPTIHQRKAAHIHVSEIDDHDLLVVAVARYYGDDDAPIMQKTNKKHVIRQFL